MSYKAVKCWLVKCCQKKSGFLGSQFVPIREYPIMRDILLRMRLSTRGNHRGSPYMKKHDDRLILCVWFQPGQFSESAPPPRPHHPELPEEEGALRALCVVQWDGLYYLVYDSDNHSEVCCLVHQDYYMGLRNSCIQYVSKVNVYFIL